jgi:Flp pilus assembly protein TadD
MNGAGMIGPVKQTWTAWHEGREGAARHLMAQAMTQSAQFDASDWQAVGYLRIEMEQAEAALQALSESARMDGTMAETFLLRGVAQRRLGAFDQAVLDYENALRLRPGWPDAINNLAITLEDCGRYDEAIRHLTVGLKQHPRDVDLWNELGSCLCAAQRAEEALQAFRKACEIDPSFAPMRWNLATALLQAGKFDQGWQMFEERLELLPGITAPECPAPMWEGQSLAGRTLLVWHEQGLGDTIQFARYLPPLMAAGAKIVLRAPKELRRLFDRMPGLEAVITPDKVLPRSDFQVPILSLPRFFWKEHGFATAEGLFGPEFKRRSQPREKLRVGLVWAGSPDHPDDARRSLSFENVQPLLSLPGIEWVSLQRGVPQLAAAPPAPVLTDFDDTAQQLSTLDVLVSCDTGTAHLAGSLGVPTLLLLPFAADWRWGERSRDTQWYPHHALMRQAKPGDWPSVITAAAEKLRELSPRPAAHT